MPRPGLRLSASLPEPRRRARARAEQQRTTGEEALGRQMELVEAQRGRIAQREERLEQQAANLEERERLLLDREVEAKRLRKEAQEVEDPGVERFDSPCRP